MFKFGKIKNFLKLENKRRKFVWNYKLWPNFKKQQFYFLMCYKYLDKKLEFSKNNK